MRALSLLYLFLFVRTISNAQHSKAELDSIVNQYEKFGWNFVLFAGDVTAPFYKKAIGFRNVEAKLPMKTSTIFKTESVGKMFTAVRILQLVQEGKLRIDQTVDSYFPELQIPNANKITLHHLLNHTSGLSSHWEHPEFIPGKNYSLEEKVRYTPVRFSNPGEKSYYSNTAYFILAAIIEKIDGTPFTRSIEKNIFKPAGMRNTTFFKKPGLPEDAALPYYQVSTTEFIKDDTSFIKSDDMGAGGWLSNAGDLYKFLQAYLKGKYLSHGIMKMQQTANGTIADTITGFRYGLMILQSLSKSIAVYGHNGGGRGYSIDAFFEPSSNYIVVVCSNMWGTGYSLTSQIFSKLLNKPVSAKPQPQVTVRLVNAIREKGIDMFEKDPDSIIKLADVPKTEFVMLRTAESLIRYNDFTTAEVVLKVGHQLFPNSPDLLLTSGHVARKQGQKTTAISFYTSAKKAAEDKNAPHLLAEANALLAELSPQK